MRRDITYLAVCPKCGRILVQEEFVSEGHWTSNSEHIEKSSDKDLQKLKCPECGGDDSFPVKD